MKVYVFTYHQVYNDEVFGTTTNVFSSREKALKAFKEWRDEEIQYAERDEWTIGTNEEGCFEAYEEGRYVDNHSEGWIEECDVK